VVAVLAALASLVRLRSREALYSEVFAHRAGRRAERLTRTLPTPRPIRKPTRQRYGCLEAVSDRSAAALAFPDDGKDTPVALASIVGLERLGSTDH
jgi:hypothetical protein